MQKVLPPRPRLPFLQRRTSQRDVRQADLQQMQQHRLDVQRARRPLEVDNRSISTDLRKEIMQVFGIAILVALVGFFVSVAISPETAMVFVVVYIVGLLVLGYVLSAMAKQQTSVVVAAPPVDVEQAVLTHFKGIGWKQVNGSGRLNFQSRGIGLSSIGSKNPVISVDLSDSVDGGTEVDVWMSEWASRVGMAASCDRVVTKRWALLRKLDAMSSVGGMHLGSS